jgi:predicted small metal-binding protein
MKAFACGDVVPGCDARWVCSSDDEILALVGPHATSAHGLTEITPQLVGVVRSSIVAA